MKLNHKASSIYVFVEDSENLLVHTTPVIHSVQNSETIIPCKPTSKSVEVELLKDNEQVIVSNIF